MNRWLVDQLPASLAGDPVVGAFAHAGQELGDTVRARVDGVELAMDTRYAGPEMLAYLGSWVGLALDPADSAELQRAMLRATGEVLTLRGTRSALMRLAEAMTGGPVSVEDAGGVFGPDVAVPAYDPSVQVRLATTGPLGLERLTTLLRQELPLGVRLEISVADQETDAGSHDES